MRRASRHRRSSRPNRTAPAMRSPTHRASGFPHRRPLANRPPPPPLAGSSDPHLVPQLLKLLRHPVWRARAMAAYALRASADASARAGMSAALTDPAWQVRVEAVEYFGALGRSVDAERVEPLLADRHPAVRLAAEQALTH